MAIEIKKVKARKVYNSRGEETIEVEVWAGEGYGRAAAPAGKSKGGKEVAYYPIGGVDESIKLIKGYNRVLLAGDPRQAEPKKPNRYSARRFKQKSYR